MSHQTWHGTPPRPVHRYRAFHLVTAAAALALFLVWPSLASAQTPFVPYFGKNQVRYDHFRWQIYTTDHFEIFYYPDRKSTRLNSSH